MLAPHAISQRPAQHNPQIDNILWLRHLMVAMVLAKASIDDRSNPKSDSIVLADVLRRSAAAILKIALTDGGPA